MVIQGTVNHVLSYVGVDFFSLRKGEIDYSKGLWVNGPSNAPCFTSFCIYCSTWAG